MEHKQDSLCTLFMLEYLSHLNILNLLEYLLIKDISRTSHDASHHSRSKLSVITFPIIEKCSVE